ncbi:ABC transporter ATP-binding protein [Corynebacterium bovis]|uniref:ABC transporter transmembrane domain-containing protein n=1 Tax=Corynebacterium bovis TaxID=36808 RepID=UPI00254F35F8|nr:ABC transporter ATP-binding protein [Corynebacterium bovis]MDK8510907.1 ABC transporter ATP-binding protein [Corynebacterium bovis]
MLTGRRRDRRRHRPEPLPDDDAATAATAPATAGTAPGTLPDDGPATPPGPLTARAAARAGDALLRAILRRHRAVIAGTTLLLCVYQVAEASVALVLGVLAGHVLASGDVRRLVGGVVLLGIVIAVVSASWRTAFRILQSRNADQVHRMRAELAARVIGHVDPPGGVREGDIPHGELPTVVGEDVVQTSDVIEVVPVSLSAAVGVVFCAAALAVVDLPLGLGVIGATVVVLVVLHLLSTAVTRRGEDQQRLLAEATSRLTDILRGLRPVAGVSGQRPAYDGYVDLSRRARDQAERLSRVTGGYEGVSTAAGVLLVATVGVAAGYRAVGGQITVGDLVTVVALSQFIAEPLRTLSRMPRYLGHARASARRVVRVRRAAAARPGRPVPEATAGVPALTVTGGGPEVGVDDGLLSAVTCPPERAAAIVEALVAGGAVGAGGVVGAGGGVAAGGVVGVGDAGGGVDAGAAVDVGDVVDVCVRGVPVGALDLGDVRARVLAEPRHPTVFAGSVREALGAAGVVSVGGGAGVGAGDSAAARGPAVPNADGGDGVRAVDLPDRADRADRTDRGDRADRAAGDADRAECADRADHADGDAVVALLAALGLGELGTRMDDVLSLQLRDGAANLSGGQRQRLALARSLVADREILVLVDPVSAVDSMTGVTVARTVRDLRKGRTTVVLAAGPAFRSVADRVVAG